MAGRSPARFTATDGRSARAARGTDMFWTNVFLGLAFVAMIAGFVWLFRDGEGPAPQPAIMRKPGTKPEPPPAEETATDAASTERQDSR